MAADDTKRPDWVARRIDFFINHFLTTFCYYFPLPLILLAVAGLFLRRLGSDYGVPDLIYHDDWGRRLVAGYALTLVVIQTLLVGYLLEAAPHHRRVYRHGFVWYAGDVLGDLVACLGVTYAVVQLARLSEYAGKDTTVADPEAGEFHVSLGVAAGAAAAILGTMLVFRIWNRGDGEAAPPPEAGPNAWARPATPDDQAAAAGPGYLFAMFVAVCALSAALVVGTYLYSRATDSAWRYPLAWGAGLGVVLVGGILFRWRFPEHAKAAVHEVVVRWNDIRDLPHTRLGTRAAVFTLAGAGSLTALAFVPAVSSPVPALCFALFLLVTGYGLLAAVVRRGLPIVYAALALLVGLAGLNHYKQRFPGLEDEYRRLDRNRLADLSGQDAAKQAEVLAFIREFQKETPAPVADGKANPAAPGADEQRKLREEYDRFRGRGLNFSDGRVVPVRDLRNSRLELAEEAYERDHAPADGPNNLRLLRLSDVKWGEKRPLIIVTVSGGGLRSAAWTLRVLQELDRAFADARLQPFASHVRIIAGASGGMLGAAFYVSTLPGPDLPEGNRHPLTRDEQDRYYKMLAGDFLTPLVNHLVYHDSWFFLSPAVNQRDRGVALEEAWDGHLTDLRRNRPALAASFAELRAREIDGKCPSLVFSPMLVEDGRRLLVSNLDMRYVASNDGAMLNAQEADGVIGASKNYSLEAIELFRLFPDRQAHFKIGTAARMSASFPYFSPAVPLPTVPRRRVVDAGYYDNYGVSVASSWLFSGRYQQWIEEHASKVIIVQVRDGDTALARRLLTTDPRTGAAGKPPTFAETSTFLSRAVEELSTPLEGLDNGRVGSSSFRNDGQLELLTKYYRERRGESRTTDQADRFLTTITFELTTRAALTWSLSARELKAIDDQAKSESFAANVALLVKWIQRAEK